MNVIPVWVVSSNCRERVQVLPVWRMHKGQWRLVSKPEKPEDIVEIYLDEKLATRRFDVLRSKITVPVRDHYHHNVEMISRLGLTRDGGKTISLLAPEISVSDVSV